MISPDPSTHNKGSRAFVLKTLRARFANNYSNVSISEQEAKLLQEAITCMEEKEARTINCFPPSRSKPFFLSLATILAAAGSFGVLAISFWQTSVIPALIASTIGLAVGVAAVKLDPG